MAILDPAEEILKYYRDNFYDGPDSFVFPILNPDFLASQPVKNRCKKVLSEVNASHKTIAAELELSELRLTTYVARHSFAVITEAPGHKSESTIQTRA